MSDDIVIRAEDISKRYRISHLAGQNTLRDTLHHAARLAWRRVRWNTRLTREDFWALRDVNFEIRRGDVVGVVGRNGAGKSTLLKILSRITEPTRGRITLKGRVASLLEVGTGFHPELTGRDNIYLNGAILGMRRAEIRAKFDEIVAFAEVERFLDTPVKRYSSGMYVRLAFSVAAHLEPEILIVDEVLAVGDAQFQKKCMGKMQQVSQGEGRTILFVSHNMAAVASLCTRAALLEGGRLVRYGPTAETLGAYINANSAKEGYLALGAARPATGVKLGSVELLNHLGARAGNVENGRPVTVRIGYHRAENFSEPVIPSLIIVTESGTPVLHHHSRLNKHVFENLPPSGFFEFTLPRLPLSAQSYFLNLALMSHNLLLDEAERALAFTVSDGPFYAPGENNPASHGLVLVDAEWTRPDSPSS